MVWKKRIKTVINLNRIWSTVFGVFKYVVVMDIIAAVIFLIMGKLTQEVTMGILFGSLFAILNFALLALTLDKAVTMGPEKAQIYAGSRYFLRMGITAIVVIVSLKADYINTIGTMVGLIMPKLAIIISSLLGINLESKRKEVGK